MADIFDRLANQEQDDVFGRQARKQKKPQGLISRILSMPQEALGEAQTIRPDTAAAAGEATLALGTGATSWIPAGLSMFSFDARTLGERANTANEIQAALTYEPRNEAGAKLAHTVAYPLTWMKEKGDESKEIYNQWADEAAERGDHKTAEAYRALAAVSGFGGEAMPFLAPAAAKPLVRGAKSATNLKGLEGVLEPTDTPTLRPGKIPASPEAPPRKAPPVEEGDVFDRIIEKQAKPVETIKPEATAPDAAPLIKQVKDLSLWLENNKGHKGTKMHDSITAALADAKAKLAELGIEPPQAPVAEATTRPTLELGKPPQEPRTREQYEKLMADTEKKNKKIANAQGVIGRMLAEGGVDFSGDYNLKEIRQTPDGKRLQKAGAKKPDEWADILNGEGYDVGSGDNLVELIKSGQARNIFTPDKQDIMIERQLRRMENEHIENTLADLAEREGIDAGAAREGLSGHKERLLGEIADEGLIDPAKQEAALKELDLFFEKATIDRAIQEFKTAEPTRPYGKPKEPQKTGEIREQDTTKKDTITIYTGDTSRLKAAQTVYLKPRAGLFEEVPRKHVKKQTDGSYLYDPHNQYPPLWKDLPSEELGKEPPHAMRPNNHEAIMDAVSDKPWEWTSADLIDLRPSERKAKLEKIWGPDENINAKKRHWVAEDYAADLEVAIKEGVDFEVGYILKEIQSRLKPQDYYAYEEVQGSRGRPLRPAVGADTGAGEISVPERAGAPKEAGELPGLSENFDLINPTTQWGTLTPKTKKPKQTTLFSGVDPTQIGPVLKSLKEKAAGTMVGRAARGLGEEIHSPEVVLSREAPGKRLYETADRADVAKNSFLSREGQAYEKQMKDTGVKPETGYSVNVGMALDGKIDPSTLSAKERSAYDFYKEKFHYLIQEAAKSAAGDQATYVQALNLANRKAKPIELVKDLSEGQRQHYKGLKTPAEKAAYLHERWKETQPEGLVKSYDILSRELKDYLPHIFDKESLLDMFKTEAADIANKLRTATGEATINQFKTRLGEVEAAIQTIQGGGFVKYESLPRNIRFKFFENRKGKEGYSFDAAKAYQTYLVGIARKIYDEPAMKAMGMEYEKLSPELKPYAEWYMRRYAGTLKQNKPLNDFANAVASFQWIRTLGFNPRSALVNLSQRLNTVAEVGVKHSLKGERYAFSPEGKALFDATGLAKEVPQVLYEGGAPALEKLRAVAGWMFQKVELGNRRHAFSSAYLEAIEKRKMTPEQAIEYATKIVHKTQFRYGRVGMPKIMTSPAGRVSLQFMSYPIKQFELLTDWAKHDPAKLIKYLAMAEGINYGLQEFLDTDMSNAIGIGMNMGEALNVLKDASKGDMREAFRHAKLTFQPGSGLLPSGFGPTVMGAGKVVNAIPEGKAMETLGRELTPVMARRGIQAVEAVRGERGGKYPIMSSSGRPTALLTARELIQRTIGPRTETEHQASLNYERRISLEKQRQEIQREIIDKVIKGDMAGARALAKESRIFPTMKQVEEEKIKRRFTREEIAKTKKPTKAHIYQLQKEGKIYY